MYYAVDIGEELTDLLGTVINVVVKVLILLIIVGLGWIIARWIRRWVRQGLSRLGFDRMVERGGMDRALGPNTASDLAARGLAIVFMLFVLQLAFNIFGPNAVSDLLHSIIAWLPRLLVAVLIVVIASAIAGWVHDAIARSLSGLTYGRAVATTVQVLVLVLGVVAALNQIGVATSVTMSLLIAALVTLAGVIIVGVGGGLVRPMQERWERLLVRAEAETTTAAQVVRGRRAEQSGVGQPAYGGGQSEPTEDLTAQQPPPEPR